MPPPQTLKGPRSVRPAVRPATWAFFPVPAKQMLPGVACEAGGDTPANRRSDTVPPGTLALGCWDRTGYPVSPEGPHPQAESCLTHSIRGAWRASSQNPAGSFEMGSCPGVFGFFRGSCPTAAREYEMTASALDTESPGLCEGTRGPPVPAGDLPRPLDSVRSRLSRLEPRFPHLKNQERSALMCRG